jgi:protoheme IX farnesyltransferase
MTAQSAENSVIVASSRSSVMRDIFILLKLRMGFLAAIIALAGYYMGSTGPVSVSGMLHAFFGTWIVSAGAFLLNMYFERDIDSLMARTADRPLPAGRMAATPVFIAGLIVSAIGIAYLSIATNLLAGAAGAAAMFGYVYVYTPLKRVSSLNTIVGSFPGAMPPIIGWAAASNSITSGAIVMFMILFLWQVPHFLALAWMHRDEYRKAGFNMISRDDPDGTITTRQNLIYGIAYVMITLLPTVFGMTGMWYFATAAISGMWFIWLCLKWYAHRERNNALQVFVATLFHSPLIYIMMVIDKLPS